MGRKKTYQRDEILNIAMHEFWQKGYVATTISSLVNATQVDKKTLFREFKNKESLFTDALNLYTQKSRDHIDKVLKHQPLGLENIHRYFNGMTAWTSRPGCLLSKTITQFNLVSQQHQEIVHETLRYLENALHANLTNAINEGFISSEMNTKQTVGLFMYAVQGLTTMSNLSPKTADIKNVSSAVLSVLEAYRIPA